MAEERQEEGEERRGRWRRRGDDSEERGEFEEDYE